MEGRLKGTRVALLVTDFFEESELSEPMAALRREGAEAVIVAPKGGEVQAVRHTEMSKKYRVDVTLAEAHPSDFDAVVLLGGALNADALRMEEKARRFVREMDEALKPVAVICHGPWLLVSAGLVRGRRMTSYHTIQDDLRNAGAKWEDTEVVRDRNWVSSRSPADLPAFNREMIALIAEQEISDRPATGRREEEVRL